MTPDAENAPLSDSEAWELPSFDVNVFTARDHTYALVIPVINEGERIRNQLLRVRAGDLPVDVVVADGGSTDGSLDTEFVTSAGVRAVLTKTGPGGLSAQLRMAYAWCLREGYRGIVTIDGNGKDGIEAINEMVAKLKAGYDYVQGSRYVRGGVAENTPLERTIANRLIHAPLLSLAGRHWFTDTTNGFRAYSARYLLDPRTLPFRDEFQSYGLLFYLTVRAGQLGLKVGQVPVTRRYPADTKVPTKITSTASKLNLLGETVNAATGGYTPDVAATQRPRWILQFLFTLLIAGILFLSSLASPNFSPDSWSYYELGQTVFNDFYRFAHFRSYWTDSPYSASFPPLFPAAIAVVDSLTNAGARSGYYLAFIFFVIFALLSEGLGRRAFGVSWLGLAISLLLLLGPEMLLGEMTAGRAIPLQLVFFALILLCLLGARGLTLAGAVGLGVVTGLAVLNRFDAVFLPLVTAAALWMLTRRPKLVLFSLLSSLVVVTPWVLYSFKTFGVPFATDNSGMATTIDRKAYVTDWWPSAQPTLADNPTAWLVRIARKSAKFALAFADVLVTPMVIVFALAILLLFGVQYLVRRGQFGNSRNKPSTGALRVVALFTVITLLLLAPQILAGYFDARYFTPLFWSGFLLIAGWTVLRGRTIHQRQVFARLMFAVISVAVLAFSGLSLVRSAVADEQRWASWSLFDNPDDVSTLKNCVRSDPMARILVLGSNKFAARAGALGGLHTMMEPQNMLDGRLGQQGSRSFLKAWDVGYVLVADQPRMHFAEATFHLERVSGCPFLLFRVIE